MDALLEKDLLPDWILRIGIRILLRQRLREITPVTLEDRHEAMAKFLDELRDAPIALQTDAANQQHYEVPPEFFLHCLGPNLKYSCGLWSAKTPDLKAAEEAMLQLTCERADLHDGQDVLELGCGWGSLTFWMAHHYPRSRITAVSNSSAQREFILERARERDLHNIHVITADMNDFDTLDRFDRVVSVEMFEHMKNHRELLRRIAIWLKPEGFLFVHIFVHRSYAYHFTQRDASDWMSRHFFTGGMMPADHQLLHFQEHLVLTHHWRVNGNHYAKTANAWLANMRTSRAKILPVLAKTYGNSDVRAWWCRWKIFFLACAELWRFQNGSEWFVAHYRFVKPSSRSSSSATSDSSFAVSSS